MKILSGSVAAVSALAFGGCQGGGSRAGVLPGRGDYKSRFGHFGDMPEGRLTLI